MIRRGLVALACLGFATLVAGQPAPTEQGENGPLKVLQLGVAGLGTFVKEWEVPGEGVDVTTTSKTVHNKPIFIVLVFSGCAKKVDGACDMTADFQILAPDGTVYDEQKAAPIWSVAPLAPNLLMLGDAKLGLTIENGEALGNYTVRIVTHDNVAKRDVTT